MVRGVFVARTRIDESERLAGRNGSPSQAPAKRMNVRYDGLAKKQSRKKNGPRPSIESRPPIFFVDGIVEVDRAGVEPATHGFSVHCSTN
jgi:hypothetical protein